MKVDNDTILSVLFGAGGVGGLIALFRQIVKGYKSDGRDIKIIDSEVKQLERLDAEVKSKSEEIKAYGDKIDRIRDIEMDGAPDIAVLGMLLEQLKTRPCENAINKNCPAENIVGQLDEVHQRMTERREKKAKILKRKEEK